MRDEVIRFRCGGKLKQRLQRLADRKGKTLSALLLDWFVAELEEEESKGAAMLQEDPARCYTKDEVKALAAEIVREMGAEKKHSLD